jgi:hypothetical protein
MPDRGTLLSSQISAFLDNDPWNTTIVNNGSYIDLVENLFYTRGQPALWFYAAAVRRLRAYHSCVLILYAGNDSHVLGLHELHNSLSPRFVCISLTLLPTV